MVNVKNGVFYHPFFIKPSLYKEINSKMRETIFYQQIFQVRNESVSYPANRASKKQIFAISSVISVI